MSSGISLGVSSLIVIISCAIINTVGYSGPFIKPCKSNDKACLKSSTQAAVYSVSDGIPELEIPSLDPIFVKSGNLDSKNLKLKYMDMHVKGIRGIKIFDVERDLKTNTVKIEAEMPIDAVGQYELDGNILFLNLYGKGDFQITTNKANFTTKYKIRQVNGPDGEAHWKIASFDYTYDVIEKVTYKLENLLGGSDSSAKLIQEVLDTNWKPIAQELGAPIVREIVTTVLGYINKFLLTIPAKELEIK